MDAADGIVLMDSGPGGSTAARMIAALRALTPKPVVGSCHSHGHPDYNDGAADWLRHTAERGETAAQLVAHDNCLRRYRRYRDVAAGRSPALRRRGVSWHDHPEHRHTAASLRWFRREVVARMNRGMSEHEILADMRCEAAITDPEAVLQEARAMHESSARLLERGATSWTALTGGQDETGK